MTSDLICPACGEIVSDSPAEDFSEEGEHETECGYCDEPVVVTTGVSVDYRVRLLHPITRGK